MVGPKAAHVAPVAKRAQGAGDRHLAPAIEMQQELGSPIEVCTFIGSSPIRQYTED